jgi:hypothetical protein
MSTLTLLPLVRVSDGVQTDEDWSLSIAYFLDDGVTPIPLTGLSFTLNVGGFATLSTSTGNLVVGGPSNNVLTITALAGAKASWPSGVWPLTLNANDGVYARDLFASSTLTIGAGQIAQVTLLVAPDASVASVASSVPAALAAALQALQPAAISAALVDLPSSELAALAQAILGALPVQSGPDAPVGAGQAFINSSGYMVVAP